MKNGKSRTRFAYIKILNSNGDVIERFSIDPKGKPVLESKTEEKVEQTKPLPKPQISKAAPQQQIDVEPVITFEPDTYAHYNHIDDEFIYKELEPLRGDFTYDFDIDVELHTAMELLPDPFFL